MRKLICRAIAWRATRDRGATAVEYALMVSLIAVAITATVFALGGRLNAIFAGVVTAVGGGAGG